MKTKITFTEINQKHRFKVNTAATAYFKGCSLQQSVRPALFLLLFLLSASSSWGQGTETFNTTGPGSWTCPAGVTSITIECWGAGGGGAGTRSRNYQSAGGGAGGGYIKTTYTVVPGTNYNYSVGTGGTVSAAVNGGNGGSTFFVNNTTINAVGGIGASIPANSNGSSSSYVTSTGATALTTGNFPSSGFITSAYASNGSNGTSTSSGAGSSGAGSGGVGGTSISGTSGNGSNGTAGTAPGGGGSGARNNNNNTSRSGGAGGNGRIIITYTCPQNAGTLSGIETVCMGSTTTFSSSVLGGTWSSGTTQVATIDSATGVITPVSAGTSVMTYTITGRGGCTNRIATRTVTVTAAPTASVSSATLGGCSGDIVSLGGSASGGTGTLTYSWSPTTGLSNSSVASPTLTLSSAQTYTLSVTDANGCSSNQPTVAVSVGNTKYWAGAGSGMAGATTGTDFNTAANWSSTTGTKTATTVPSSCDNVNIITTGPVIISISQNTTINNLTILNNGNNTIAFDARTYIFDILGNSTINSNTGGTSSNKISIRVGNAPGKIIFNGTADFGPNNAANPFIGFEGSAAGNTTGTVVFKNNTSFSITYGTSGFIGSIGSFIWDGIGTQTISTNPSYVVGFPGNVHIGDTNTPRVEISTITATGCFVGANKNMTIKSGAILDLKTKYFYPSAVGTGTLTIQSGAHLICGGTINNGSGTNNFPTNFGTYSFNSNSTVEYNGTAAQGVNNTPTYGNLTISKNSVKTAAGVLTIAGNLLINSTATFAAGNFTHNVSGNWINNGGTFTNTGSTINFNGATQSIGGSNSTTFNNLTLAGSATKTIDVATIVNNTMTVSSATTNNSTLTVTGALSGAGSLTQGASSILNIGGTSGITGLDASTNTNNVNYTGANQAVKAVTYSSLTINGSGTATIGGTTTVNATMTVTSATTNNSTLTVTGALSGGSTLTQGISSVLNIAGTSGITGLAASTNANTVNYTGAAQTVKPVAYRELSLTGTGNKTISTGTSVAGLMSITGVKASIGTGITIPVGSLSLGGRNTANGTWGSTSSAATYQTNTFFDNTGTLTVSSNNATPVQLTGTRNYDGTTLASASNLSIFNNTDEGNLTLSGVGLLSLEDVGNRTISVPTSVLPVRRQFATGDTGVDASTTCTVTLGSNPVNGNTLIAVISTRNNSQNTVQSISQTGTTWTRATQAVNTGGNTIEIWYAEAKTTSNASVTVTMNQISVRTAAVVMEYSGVLALNPIDVVNNANGNSTAASTGSVTTTSQENELLIGGIGFRDSTNSLSSLSGGFTQIATTATSSSASNNTRIYALEQIVTATGTYAAGGTISASTNWAGAIASFKAIVPSGTSNVLSLGGSAAGFYTLAGMTGTMDITPKPLTITPTISSKVYDGLTTTGSITIGTLGGLISPENINVSAVGNFEDANVGTGKTAAVTYTLTDGVNGGLASNYSLANGSATGDITPKTLTITALNKSKCQGIQYSLPSNGYETVGLVVPETIDSVTLSSTGAVSSATAGTYPIVPSAATGGSFTAANYDINYVNGTLTVNALPNAPTGTNGSICGTGTVTVSASAANGETIDWYSASTGGELLSSGSTSYSPSISSTTTYYAEATNTATGCISATRTPVTATVNPIVTPSVTISTSPSSTFCSGAEVTFTATPTNGGAAPYYQWKLNGVSIIGANSPTFTSTTLTNGQIITVEITSDAVCSSTALSTGITTTVNTPIGITAITPASAAIATGQTTTITATGVVGTAAVVTWYPNANQTGSIGTGLTSPAVGPGTYYAVVSGTCGDPIQLSTIISSINSWTGNVSTAWDDAGNWAGGVPNGQTAVVIGSAANQPIISGTNNFANSITLVDNAVLTINTQGGLNVTNDITVANTAQFIVNNNANLMQVNPNAVNTGIIKVRKRTQLLRRLDYILWSSPTQGTQTLKQFSPQTVDNRFYTYNSTTNSYSVVANVQTPFESGKGYLIRTPNNHPTTPTFWDVEFQGTPNNGTIVKQLSTPPTAGNQNRYFAVGNPYASAINISSFLEANQANITAIYLWRKTNGADRSGYSVLQRNTINTFTFNSNGEGVNPNNCIPAGQGFIVEMNDGASQVVFTNAMRVCNQFGEFNRTTQETDNDHANDQLTLKFSQDNGQFTFASIGYFANASNEFEAFYDAQDMGDGTFSVASALPEKRLAIQSRAAFTTTDVVPLSLITPTAGAYQLSLDQVGGLFADSQNVYLRDNVTTTVHNLTEGAYDFTSDAGTFSTRFELLYQYGTLGVDNPVLTENQVVIFKTRANELSINTGNFVMDQVMIYDVNGRLLTEVKNINNTQTLLKENFTTDVLLVKIKTQEGKTVTKKVLFPRTSLKKDVKVNANIQLAEDE